MTALNRILGITFGVVTHALLAASVWYVFWFLKGGVVATETGSLTIDVALCAQFGILHSLLLHPAVRQRLSTWIESPHYGCFFCTVTCLSLLGTIYGWQPSPDVWWILPQPWHTLIGLAYLGSWVLLLYSISLTGFGWQSGATPWWNWVRGLAPPQRPVVMHSLYRWLRHPVYLGFLGLIWCTPVMTTDRAILCAIWTAYVFVGSTLKDRRLEFFLGDRYREYQARVPGYPGMVAGPLARVRRRATNEAPLGAGGHNANMTSIPDRTLGAGVRAAPIE